MRTKELFLRRCKLQRNLTLVGEREWWTEAVTDYTELKTMGISHVIVDLLSISNTQPNL